MDLMQEKAVVRFMRMMPSECHVVSVEGQSHLGSVS